MRTHPHRLAALLGVLVFVLAACGNGSTATGAAATVNGVDIPRSQLDEAVREIVDANFGDASGLDADARAAMVEPIQYQVLGLFIQSEIITGLAASYGFEMDEAQLAERLETEAERMGGMEGLEGALTQSGLTLDLFRTVFLPTQLKVEHIREALVADADPFEQRTVRHILVDTQAEADEIMDELNDGGDFAEIASTRSTDPGTAVRGGDLGPASRGAYVPEFDEAVWTSAIGDLVGPVESQFGFHVLEIMGETVTAPEDLGPQELDQMVGAELGALIEAAILDADVQVAPGLGVWDAGSASVVPEDLVGTGGQ